MGLSIKKHPAKGQINLQEPTTPWPTTPGLIGLIVDLLQDAEGGLRLALRVGL